MDFNQAMAVAKQAEEDGVDVAADNMRAAIREQDANIKEAAAMNSDHEDWLRQIDVPYINACTDVEELHKIASTMEKEGFAGLMKCANERLQDFTKCAALPADLPETLNAVSAPICKALLARGGLRSLLTAVSIWSLLQ